MELFLADFVNVPEYVEKFLSVPRPWSRHEYNLYTPGLGQNRWKPLKRENFKTKTVLASKSIHSALMVNLIKFITTKNCYRMNV